MSWAPERIFARFEQAMPNLQVCRLAPEEVAFANALLRESMTPHVHQTWADEGRRAAYFELNSVHEGDTNDDWIIKTAEGDSVGRVSLGYRELTGDRAFGIDELDEQTPAQCAIIREMHLVEAWRGQQLGTRLIRHTLEECDRCGLDTVLLVLACNPARHLYGRLGFEVIAEHDGRLLMLRPAPETR